MPWRTRYSSVFTACVKVFPDGSCPQRDRFTLSRPLLATVCARVKFDNYMAVTLGLEGDERDKVSARLWDAVDRRLKLEAGPGVDCLLTRVQSRLVHSCGKRRFALQQLSAHGQCDRVSQTRTNTRIHEIMGASL